MESVDAVVLFDDDTPLTLVSEIMPDVLVGCGDCAPQSAAGADVVISGGGRVHLVESVEGAGTTELFSRIGQKTVQGL